MINYLEQLPEEARLIGVIAGWDAVLTWYFGRIHLDLLWSMVPGTTFEEVVASSRTTLETYRRSIKRKQAQALVNLAGHRLDGELQGELLIALEEARLLAERRGVVVHSLFFPGRQQGEWNLLDPLDPPVGAQLRMEDLRKLREDYEYYVSRLKLFSFRVTMYAVGFGVPGEPLKKGRSGLQEAGINDPVFRPT